MYILACKLHNRVYILCRVYTVYANYYELPCAVPVAMHVQYGKSLPA